MKNAEVIEPTIENYKSFKAEEPWEQLNTRGLGKNQMEVLTKLENGYLVSFGQNGVYGSGSWFCDLKTSNRDLEIKSTMFNSFLDRGLIENFHTYKNGASFANWWRLTNGALSFLNNRKNKG